MTLTSQPPKLFNEEDNLESRVECIQAPTVKDGEGFPELYESIASPADKNDSSFEEVPCPIREAVSSSEDKEEPLKECGEDASDQQEFENGDQTQGIEGEKENRIRY